MIRWKHHTAADDSWEPEENLDCHDLIEAFMSKWEKESLIEEKALREVRKPVKRLAFAAPNSRNSKRMGGFRVTYEDMDE